MADERSYRAVTENQRKTLLARGCTADDWNQV
ncbi:unnamed protein product, partial [marine sediment metagenome]